MGRTEISPEIKKRTTASLHHVNRITELGRVDMDRALRAAGDTDDPSAHAAALIVLAKRTRDIGTLADARNIVLGGKLSSSNRTTKLARISFVAVGVDNVFAAETANEVGGSKTSAQLNRQLSLAMTSSIKRKIDSGQQDEFSRYSDFVAAAFHEAVGDSTYFGEEDDVALGRSNFRAPLYLVERTPREELDPIRDGAVALGALRSQPEQFEDMLNLIVTQASGQVSDPVQS